MRRCVLALVRNYWYGRSVPVLSFVNQKGGVGKTTLAVHVAAALAQSHRVLLVDADPQGSALDWSNARQPTSPTLPVIGLPKPTLHREVVVVGRDYDWTVIDGPPHVNTLTRAAAAASDIVLIPVQPSPLDVWATEDVVNLLAECAVVNPGMRTRFVVNRLVPRTTLSRELTVALGSLSRPVVVCDSVIRNRTEYAKAMRRGLTALDTQPHGAAAAEIRALVDELVKIIQIQEQQHAN